MPPTTARILLNFHKWNRTQLIQQYFECDENIDGFFAQAKLPNPWNDCLPLCVVDSTDSNACLVCYTDYDESSLFSLQCGHRYCKDCWNQYLTGKIAEEGLTDQLLCMDPKCKLSVPDEIIMDIVLDPSVKTKYEYFMTRNFVEVRI